MTTKQLILLKVNDYHPLTIINNILKKIFIIKTLNHYENLGKPYGIIINENLLKFHNGDIREEIKKELLK